MEGEGAAESVTVSPSAMEAAAGVTVTPVSSTGVEEELLTVMPTYFNVEEAPEGGLNTPFLGFTVMKPPE